jgi:hypothetical protein
MFSLRQGDVESGLGKNHMKINVRVKTSKKQVVVQRMSATEFEVALTAPARDNRANLELIDVMAKHFHVPKSRVRICSGMTYKKKILEIL